MAWYGVVNQLYCKICLVVWYVSVYKVRKGRICLTNIICNDLIYRPLESVRKYKLCGQTDRQTDIYSFTAAETQLYKLRIGVRTVSRFILFQVVFFPDAILDLIDFALIYNVHCIEKDSLYHLRALFKTPGISMHPYRRIRSTLAQARTTHFDRSWRKDRSP